MKYGAVKTWTLYLAVFMAILSALITILTCIAEGFLLYYVINAQHAVNGYNVLHLLYFTMTVAVFAAVYFMFTLLLICGIKKKILRLVNAFTNYGIVVAVGIFITAILLYWFQYLHETPVIGFFIISLFHLILLVFTSLAEEKMSSSFRREPDLSLHTTLLFVEIKT